MRREGLLKAQAWKSSKGWGSFSVAHDVALKHLAVKGLLGEVSVGYPGYQERPDNNVTLGICVLMHILACLGRNTWSSEAWPRSVNNLPAWYCGAWILLLLGESLGIKMEWKCLLLMALVPRLYYRCIYSRNLFPLLFTTHQKGLLVKLLCFCSPVFHTSVGYSSNLLLYQKRKTQVNITRLIFTWIRDTSSNSL